MSDPHSRVGEARKQIRLAAEDLERRSAIEDLDEDVVENLEEAARLLAAVQAELVEAEDDPLSER